MNMLSELQLRAPRIFPQRAKIDIHALASPHVFGEASSDLRVTLAQTEQDLAEVYRLTHDRYVDMGYAVPRADRQLSHFPELDGIAQTYVIMVKRKETLMGTVSLTMDGFHGLHVDKGFKNQADQVRREGRTLASCWRIVTRAMPGERRVVMTLIGSVVHLAFKTLRCQTFLNTFNPRHERIYGKLLNMTTIGKCKEIDTLINAPAVLMRCDVERCPARWLVQDASQNQSHVL